jgi:hypothetical protein
MNNILSSISNHLLNDKIIQKLDKKYIVPNNSFYKLYIEHNMMIIIIIVCIVLVLVIQYLFLNNNQELPIKKKKKKVKPTINLFN